MDAQLPPLAPRRIAHLDMDAFFASVELLRYPELRGMPVVVGGGRSATPETLPDGTRRYKRLRDYAGRGVVTTSTYEARKFGVFSAMGMMKAAQLAPDAVLLPTDFDSYRHYSRLFKSQVAAFTDQIEDRGIDEFMAQQRTMNFADAAFAQEVQRRRGAELERPRALFARARDILTLQHMRGRMFGTELLASWTPKYTSSASAPMAWRASPGSRASFCKPPTSSSAPI